jgi:hypothetical protein
LLWGPIRDCVRGLGTWSRPRPDDHVPPRRGGGTWDVVVRRDASSCDGTRWDVVRDAVGTRSRLSESGMFWPLFGEGFDDVVELGVAGSGSDADVPFVDELPEGLSDVVGLEREVLDDVVL